MNPQKAADDLKNLVKRFKPLFGLVEELDKIASLKQYCEELESRKEKLVKEIERAEGNIESVDAGLVQAVEELEEAKKSSKNLILDGQEVVRQMVNKAKEEAGEILDSANRLKAEAKEIHKAANEKSKSVDDDIKAKEEQLSQLTNKLDGLKQKVSAIMDV